MGGKFKQVSAMWIMPLNSRVFIVFRFFLLTNCRYDSKSGTSMAAPHVTGVAALVWSHFPTMSAAQIWKALTDSALDLGPSGRDDSFGHGFVQAKAAIDVLTAMSPSSLPSSFPSTFPSSSPIQLPIFNSPGPGGSGSGGKYYQIQIRFNSHYFFLTFPTSHSTQIRISEHSTISTLATMGSATWSLHRALA